jgi:hypothetical protein
MGEVKLNLRAVVWVEAEPEVEVEEQEEAISEVEPVVDKIWVIWVVCEEG